MTAMGHFRLGGGWQSLPPYRLCPESGSELRALASVMTGRGGLIILLDA
jgi:hypothetical protein